MSSKSVVGNAWNRIESWLGANAPENLPRLGEPASQETINRLESKLDVLLSESFIESFKIHNGQDDFDLIPYEGGSMYLLKLEAVFDEWSVMAKMAESGEFDGTQTTHNRGITPEWWNRAWIPFASDGGGDLLCLDLAPTADGNAGQVIVVQHEDCARDLVAPNFGDWLTQLATDLEFGKLVIEDE